MKLQIVSTLLLVSLLFSGYGYADVADVPNGNFNQPPSTLPLVICDETFGACLPSVVTRDYPNLWDSTRFLDGSLVLSSIDVQKISTDSSDGDGSSIDIWYQPPSECNLNVTAAFFDGSIACVANSTGFVGFLESPFFTLDDENPFEFELSYDIKACSEIPIRESNVFFEHDPYGVGPLGSTYFLNITFLNATAHNIGEYRTPTVAAPTVYQKRIIDFSNSNLGLNGTPDGIRVRFVANPINGTGSLEPNCINVDNVVTEQTIGARENRLHDSYFENMTTYTQFPTETITTQTNADNPRFFVSKASDGMLLGRIQFDHPDGAVGPFVSRNVNICRGSTCATQIASAVHDEGFISFELNFSQVAGRVIFDFIIMNVTSENVFGTMSVESTFTTTGHAASTLNFDFNAALLNTTKAQSSTGQLFNLLDDAGHSTFSIHTESGAGDIRPNNIYWPYVPHAFQVFDNGSVILRSEIYSFRNESASEPIEITILDSDGNLFSSISDTYTLEAGRNIKESEIFFTPSLGDVIELNVTFSNSFGGIIGTFENEISTRQSVTEDVITTLCPTTACIDVDNDGFEDDFVNQFSTFGICSTGDVIEFNSPVCAETGEVSQNVTNTIDGLEQPVTDIIDLVKGFFGLANNSLDSGGQFILWFLMSAIFSIFMFQQTQSWQFSVISLLSGLVLGIPLGVVPFALGALLFVVAAVFAFKFFNNGSDGG